MENVVKEPAPKYNFISPKEYLEMERASEEKHEYFDGHVYNMFKLLLIYFLKQVFF
jgi:hypothetical protein